MSSVTSILKGVSGAESPRLFGVYFSALLAAHEDVNVAPGQGSRAEKTEHGRQSGGVFSTLS